MNFLQDRKVFMSQQQSKDSEDDDDDEDDDGPSIGLSPEAMAALLEFAQEKGCALGTKPLTLAQNALRTLSALITCALFPIPTRHFNTDDDENVLEKVTSHFDVKDKYEDFEVKYDGEVENNEGGGIHFTLRGLKRQWRPHTGQA